MPGIITLLTDFGLADGYVAAMKGVILGLNPQAVIVDVTHEVPPQDVGYAAYVLATVFAHFPPGTVHVAVVDPGVGSARAGVAVQGAEQYSVAPGNGVLSHVIAAGHATAVRLSEPRFWRPEPSRTFHGRDIFAPVAAHLSLGVPLAALGEPLADLVRLPRSEPERRPDGAWVVHVIHVDRFGNLITDLRPDPAWLDRLAGAQVGSFVINAVAGTYADVPSRSPAILTGSGGYLEIAVRDGSAAAEFQAGVGDQVLLFPL
ncbi:MAG TPA: SAM-dependent chlorinase/fluorinase [Anaerolineae bacterium]|nr:SAM-dependent chlorinase/fluorinase [Anaerolineae bacterium]